MLAALLATTLLAAPVCAHPTVPLPPHEPHLTAGRSALVAGLYEQGGALVPECPQRPRGPYAGTLVVRSAGSGRVVARETLRRPGRLFRLSLPPGRYEISASERGGLRTAPQAVTIPPHRVVRQDVFVDVP